MAVECVTELQKCLAAQMPSATELLRLHSRSKRQTPLKQLARMAPKSELQKALDRLNQPSAIDVFLADLNRADSTLSTIAENEDEEDEVREKARQTRPYVSYGWGLASMMVELVARQTQAISTKEQRHQTEIDDLQALLDEARAKAIQKTQETEKARAKARQTIQDKFDAVWKWLFAGAECIGEAGAFKCEVPPFSKAFFVEACMKHKWVMKDDGRAYSEDAKHLLEEATNYFRNDYNLTAGNPTDEEKKTMGVLMDRIIVANIERAAPAPMARVERAA